MPSKAKRSSGAGEPKQQQPGSQKARAHKAGKQPQHKHAAKAAENADEQPASAARARSASPAPAPPQQTEQQHPAPPAAHSSASPAPPSIITSRLCVKNLPKDMTAPKLKEHFAVKGEVTDVKILKTRDGKPRQMAFIGYKTAEDAAAAQKYFNNTFIYASRITVEFAFKYHDPALARPWSKHSEGSSARQRQLQQQQAEQQKQEGSKKKGGKGEVDGNMVEARALAARIQSRNNTSKDQKGEVDPKLAEFLALMAPRRRAKLWTNDDLMPEQTLEDLKARARAGSKSEGEEEGHEGGESSSDEEYTDLNAPSAAAASDGDADTGSSSEEGGVEEEPQGQKDPTVLEEGVSDLDYLKSRMRKWNDGSGDESEEEEEDASLNAARRGDQSGVSTSKSPSPAPSSDKSARAQARAAAEQGAQSGKAGSADRGGSSEPMDMDGGKAEDGNQGPQVVNAVSEGSDPVDLISDTGRLFVRNLAYSTTEADLAELFGQFGDVSEVHLVLDRETKKSKAIAYVLFVIPSDAIKAYQQLDGQIFQGRLLHILPANRPPAVANTGLAKDEEGGDKGKGAGSSFKTEREQQRKSDAGNRAAWNSLFIRPDTVAEAIAAHYGVSKSELMDPFASGDLPVRMALGEAAVIAQTKTALAEEGVDVSKLEAAASASGKASTTKSVARSDRTLLVKNLPYSASEEELHAMFARCGPLARLVLPPSHALALVEFNEPQDARTAFKALAYKKYQHVPLYLEWAPHEIFSTPPPPPQDPKQQQQQQQQGKRAQQAASKQSAPGVANAQGEGVEGMEGVQGPGAVNNTSNASTNNGEDEDDEDRDVTTLYVKNLAFATTDDAFRKHFDRAVSSVGGTLHSARVARRKGPHGEMLSAGFGFVEVNSPDVATQVIKKLQGSTLDNHKLSMQLSKRRAPVLNASQKQQQGGAAAANGAAEGKGKKGDGATTKLLIRNVAFEATRKDLLGLVSPFGHLKSCRLPKKFDGNHRGYAFVEFVTKQEARNALEGVGGVHLYGRRLVVEYAKEDEGLDELRTKTAAKYKGDETLDTLAPAAKRLREDL